MSREFALVYGPAIVAAVNMIQDTSTLEPLATEYNQVGTTAFLAAKGCVIEGLSRAKGSDDNAE